EALIRARPPRVREQDALPRHELAAVIVAHGPGDEQQLAPLDGALEERLARPGALHEPALIPHDRAEHPQAAARGDHPGAHHTPHAAHLLAHARLRQGRHPRGVEVAVRGVVQQIAHRPDAEPRESLGPLGPDALQVLDRRPERQIHDPSPFPLPRLVTGPCRPLRKPLPPPPRPLGRERPARRRAPPHAPPPHPSPRAPPSPPSTTRRASRSAPRRSPARTSPLSRLLHPAASRRAPPRARGRPARSPRPGTPTGTSLSPTA